MSNVNTIENLVADLTAECGSSAADVPFDEDSFEFPGIAIGTLFKILVITPIKDRLLKRVYDKLEAMFKGSKLETLREDEAEMVIKVMEKKWTKDGDGYLQEIEIRLPVSSSYDPARMMRGISAVLTKNLGNKGPQPLKRISGPNKLDGGACGES